jgi:hypothetical protein
MLGDADELAVVTCNGLKDEDFDWYPLRDTEGATMVGELLGTTAETSELERSYSSCQDRCATRNHPRPTPRSSRTGTGW